MRQAKVFKFCWQNGAACNTSAVVAPGSCKPRRVLACQQPGELQALESEVASSNNDFFAIAFNKYFAVEFL